MRGRDPLTTGIIGYRMILIDAFEECKEHLGNDLRYAACVRRLHRLSLRVIADHKPLWDKLKSDPATGFWVHEDGRPIKPGDTIPKNVWIDMEGAIMHVLYDAGVFGIRGKQRDDAKDKFAKHNEGSQWADDSTS